MPNRLLKTIFCLMLVCSNYAVGLEKPEYEVVFSDDQIEYRLYDPYVVAETSVEIENSYNNASNKGFRRLLNYISGENTISTKIDMTAPVQMSRNSSATEIAMTAPVQSQANGNELLVAFMLPSEYSFGDAPTPNDPRVSLRIVPSRLMAVIRYSGRWTESNRIRYETRLRESLEAANIEILSNAESAAYNPPFTPPFMRRNEIMLEVATYPRSET